jgi:hypothetical protein
MAVGNNTPYLGYDSYIAVGEETTFGTYVTGSSYAEFASESFMKEREELRLESINTTRDFTRRLTGNETISGGLELDLNPAEDSIMWIVKQAMGGTVSTAQVSATSYLHTFNVGDMENNQSSAGAADVKSLSIQVRRGSTSQWTYRGMRVNNMTIKGEVGSPITASFEFMGQAGTSTADSLTASFSAINPLNFTGVTLQTGDSITNVATEYFTGFEVTLNNNIVEQRNVGSAIVHAIPPVKRDVTLKLTQQFDTTTAYNRFIQNTVTSIQIRLDTGSTIGGTGGTTASMVLRFPVCYFNNNTPQVGESGPISQEIDVSTIRDTSTSYVMQIDVANETTSY